MTRRLALLAAVALLGASPAARAAAPVPIVAAENFYGDVARQVGGAQVAVTSILASPDQDPHLFEASPSVARAVAAARVVIANGIGYDPWMGRLLRAAPRAGRTEIVVARLAGRAEGDNPHIWYDPHAMIALADALAGVLGTADPAHRAAYAANADRFRASLAPLLARIASLRARFAGTPVTATEPVFGEMFAALGMDVRNRRFQFAVMNDTEPAASDVAAFESDLKARRVRLLVYNAQASGAMARRMRTIAEKAHIPVVAVTETEPAGETYQHWMATALDAVARSLAAPRP